MRKLFLQKCNGATISKSIRIDVKPLKRKPTAPFTTSNFTARGQQETWFFSKQNHVQRTAIVRTRFDNLHAYRFHISLSEVALSSIAQEIENKLR